MKGRTSSNQGNNIYKYTNHRHATELWRKAAYLKLNFQMAKAKMETPSSTKFIGSPRKNKSVASKKWSVFWYLFKLSYAVSTLRASLVAQMVKRLPAMQETWVRSLGQEDPLEKAVAPHSSTLAWKIPWTKEPGWLLSMGLQRVGHD